MKNINIEQVSEKVMLTAPSILCKVENGSFPSPKLVTSNHSKEHWLRQDIGNWLVQDENYSSCWRPSTDVPYMEYNHRNRIVPWKSIDDKFKLLFYWFNMVEGWTAIDVSDRSYLIASAQELPGLTIVIVSDLRSYFSKSSDSIAPMSASTCAGVLS